MSTSVLPSSSPPGLWVPPRFATARDPRRRTEGPAVGRVARALGTPLMPWQQYVHDVAGEVDDRGLFVYSLIVCTVQRQAGKTTAKQAKSVQRALRRPNRRVWDTAQTGQAARDKHRELSDTLMQSALRDLVVERRRAAGSEGLTFVNGSTLRPFPPTRDALHGTQGDDDDIDEGWAFDPERGNELLQAIVPTQATRPGAQTWVWSTRGDRFSTWFHGLLEQGFAGMPGVAVFDWSIPDDADPSDLEVIAAHHPAYGHTINMDTLRAAQAALPPGEFARAYGNRQTGAGERVLPLEPWLAARVEDDAVRLPPGRPAYGIATAGDGSATAIVAAVLGADGVPWVEVVEHRPGRSWAIDRARELRDAGQGIAIDRRGPAAPIADQLELAGVELIPLQAADYTAACQDVFDRITDPAGPRIRHRMHAALDDAADVAGRRVIGDGGWVWSRAKSGGDVSPLEGATLAAWAVLRNPEPEPTPFVVFA